MDDEKRPWNAADKFINILGYFYFTARSVEANVRVCPKRELQKTYSDYLSLTEGNLSSMLTSQRFKNVKGKLDMIRELPRSFDEKNYIKIRDTLDYIAEEYKESGVMEILSSDMEPEELVNQQLR